MITDTLDRLIGYGPLLSVSCRWCEYDDEDMRRAVADGEWQVGGIAAHGGEHWLASGDDEREARKFAVEAGLFLGVPMRTAEPVQTIRASDGARKIGRCV